MENTVELTKSLISLQITENAEADDTALKPMLAGMVQLAHAALNVFKGCCKLQVVSYLITRRLRKMMRKRSRGYTLPG